MCVAMACSVGIAMAQYPDQAKDKAQDKTAKADTVTITGCVADKDAKGHFMLNNAAAAPSPSSAASPTTVASSYVLSGGGDLKAHVGHKVEITGTIDQAKMSDKPADTATGTSGSTPEKGASADTLKVKSVKMVAETCQ